MRETELRYEIQLISNLPSHLGTPYLYLLIWGHLKDMTKTRLCLPIKYKIKTFWKHFLARLHSCLFLETHSYHIYLILLIHKCGYFAANSHAAAPVQMLNRPVWAVRPTQMGLLICQVRKKYLEHYPEAKCYSLAIQEQSVFKEQLIKNVSLMTTNYMALHKVRLSERLVKSIIKTSRASKPGWTLLITWQWRAI